VPASEAYATLSSLGTPSGLYPLPVGLHHLAVNFTSLPDDNAVMWKFSEEGEDLATIVARVQPSGDAASNVMVYYAKGTAPDEKGRNAQLRRLLETHVQRLVVEAVDSKFEKRPFNSDLRAEVSMATASASVGSMMQEVDASLDAEIARREEAENEKRNRASVKSANLTKPTMDLSQYN
jgi:hypothetical protein